MARISLLALMAALVYAQMPKGLPNRDSYAIRIMQEGEPCGFSAEYERVKSNKRDPRVAFVELGVKLEGETGLDFEAFCRLVSDQAEDSVATYDAKNGFFQVMMGRADVNWAVASFSGKPDITMLVKREGSEWQSWVFQFSAGQWTDVTAKFWKSKQYPLLPQYGRTIRLMQGLADQKPRPIGWLTWNGKEFVKGSGAGWRCPDSYQYFEPAQRLRYCKP